MPFLLKYVYLFVSICIYLYLFGSICVYLILFVALQLLLPETLNFQQSRPGPSSKTTKRKESCEGLCSFFVSLCFVLWGPAVIQ